MSGLQRDLYDDTVFHYDWHGDLWNLGDLRDVLGEGDTFMADGKTWFILGRSNISQSFTITEESVFKKGVSDRLAFGYCGKMRKAEAQKKINYILKQLLEYRDCLSLSNVVDIDGSLYDDIVKDMETYLELYQEPS